MYIQTVNMCNSWYLILMRLACLPLSSTERLHGTDLFLAMLRCDCAVTDER